MKARYKNIVDRYADAIRSGRLHAGTKLPTHRKLSAEESISLATATRVYAELGAMGLVSGETGRGTFVRDISLPTSHGMDQQMIASDVVDLNFNYPTLPEQDELLRNALRTLSLSEGVDTHLLYSPHAGSKSDRETFALHFSKHGMTFSADELLIVNGAQHGLMVAVMGLLQPGDVVAVDALTYPGFKALAQLYHIELVPVSFDYEGPDLRALRHLCIQRKIKALYTMPTLHNPLGWVLSDTQRMEIAEIARLYDFLIIEDTAYGYLVDNPPLPIYHHAPERTVFITGFSKNVATGLRVGVVIAPQTLRADLERAIRVTTWNTPSLLTTIVRNWVEDGVVKQLEEKKRADAGMRQRLVKEILSPLDYISHPASYFIWLPLDEGVRSDHVTTSLIKHNISVSTAAPFCVTKVVPHALRIALGSVTPSTLRTALQTIKDCIIDNYR
ncbi:PLP-dependent aminotransferase family protein [Vibrio neptunius]|uniref:aminotransferase-like domain-containing protein n=2 Tax=Vibrio TaxID=662 RepID=UPI0019D12343|nr:PLP-dependent aminotransferase family protein [Vibrio neptunius]MBN3574508.1 PLP-dependent aminotransferase family protein [Vibrio neptunius]QXX05837.1 PLP-dependent aminotransferase family protein [Vibrio neptunius]